MKILAITQARTGSSRLPNKILLTAGGKTLLETHLRRMQKSRRISKLIVATTTEKADETIAELCQNLAVDCFRGSETDVLDRYYQASKSDKPDYVVRVTSDCPLMDAALVDEMIDFIIEKDVDYVSNWLEYNYPDGIAAEVFRFAALEKAWHEARLVSEREHVTPYIWKNSTFKGGQMFSSDNFRRTSKNYPGVRITVDEPADYELIKTLISRLGIEESWETYAEEVLRDETLSGINGHIVRNEGYAKSIDNDQKIEEKVAV